MNLEPETSNTANRRKQGRRHREEGGGLGQENATCSPISHDATRSPKTEKMMPSFGYNIYSDDKFIHCTYSIRDAERWGDAGYRIERFSVNFGK